MTTPPDRPVHPSERRGGRRHRFWVLAAGTAVAALLATGCSSDNGDDASASTTVAETTTTAPESTSTTTTEPRTPEEEVEEAYWEAERVLDDLLQDPNPDDPRLAETRVDPSLSHVSTYLGEMREDGIAVRWAGEEPPPIEVQSVEVLGDEATVVSCQIDNTIPIDVATGEALGDQVLSGLVEVSLNRIDGTWMVSSSETTAEWPDGMGCDR